MKVKVNDTEIELPPGTSAIDAVFSAGYDVPYFCSLEYLSPIGACRMCLARIGAPRKDRASGELIMDEETGEPKIFYMPNLPATCTTQVSEGMVIDTLSKDVKAAQNGMVEFHLINHPLDCPVCDKGGACELQDRSVEYGNGLSRFVFDKRHNEKHAQLSPLVTLDRERCIHCKRCVRYFEEIPGDEVMDFIERGGHTFIGSAEVGLPSNFSGNIDDICPVGALLDTTSRFRGRNWEYDHTRSTCLDCPVGCALKVDARTGRIERIQGALNPQVNNIWLCDGGRFGHEYVDDPDRFTTPMLRKDGELMPVSWEEAAQFIREKLSGLEVGIALRADATLEEGVAAKALAGLLKTQQLDHSPRPAASVIPVGEPATLNDVASADAIFVLGDVTEEAPIVDLRIKEALKGVTPPEMLPFGAPRGDLRLKERMPRKREKLAVAAPYRVNLMKHAGLSLRYKAGAEAEFLAALLEVANGGKLTDKEAADLGLDAEEANTQLAGLAERLKTAENAVIVGGGFVLASPEAAGAFAKLAKLVGAKQLLLGPMANSYGLEVLGVLPGAEGYPEMLSGSAKALILSGLDPARDAGVAENLKKLELLVVHDSFPSATTDLADVVLPAKTGYEKEGTVVNIEGRYLPVQPSPIEGGQSEDFTGVVKLVGEAFGERLEGRSSRSAWRSLKKTLGFDPGELPPEGHLAPSKGRTVNAKAVPTSGNLLLTPNMNRLEYFSRNPHLRAAYGGAALRLHPEDAAARGLTGGEEVELQVGGITRTATVKVTEDAPRGLLLLPGWLEPVDLANTDLDTLKIIHPPLEVVA
jgi:NADH-quinone oxidoreductase subunit G